MEIKNLQLHNFKNYSFQNICFNNGLNVLHGKNAQGKTNCVEAIFYLCTGTSLRTKKNKNLIKNGEESATITANFNNKFGTLSIEAKIFEHNRELYINGTKLRKSSELIGNINCVFFSPSELRLIQDGPDERRRFLNISISQTSKQYYTALIRYNSILEQRNALLKERDTELILSTLPAWDEQLCEYASQIIYARQGYVEKISEFAKQNHAFLTGGQENLELTLEKNYKGEKQDIYAKLYNELANNYEKDIRLGYTTVGPHRDDIDIVLDGMDAKSFSSQGQTRTIALAVKLSEVDMYYKLNEEYPILILDDVLSELDIERRKKLIQKLNGMQTILTCTNNERSLAFVKCKRQRIVNGAIK